MAFLCDKTNQGFLYDFCYKISILKILMAKHKEQKLYPHREKRTKQEGK